MTDPGALPDVTYPSHAAPHVVAAYREAAEVSSDAQASVRWGRLPRWVWIVALALLLSMQAAFGLQGINNYWQWGHNGYNGAAYQLGARNALRWGLVFPAQYASGVHQPAPGELYTHAPLGLHLHNMVSVLVFGDRELAIRVVPAVYGFLAACVLFAFVKRRWGDLHAVVMLAVYVLLPINQGYANMTNHDTGCIFWSLLMLWCHIKWTEAADRPPQAAAQRGLKGLVSQRPWLWAVGSFFCCLMAVNWNWPAYFMCFLMAWHWLYVSHDAAHRRLPHWFGFNREHALLALYCVFVLVNFFGFFALVYAVVGSFDEMSQSLNLRSGSTTDVYSRLWRESLEPMFSAPLLVLGLLWVVGLIVRHSRGETRAAELVPLCFGFAGVMHVMLFKKTVLVHIYWPWQLNPFVALAAAVVLLWCTRTLSALAEGAWRRLRESSPPPMVRRASWTLAALVVFVPFTLGYLQHTLPLIPEARRVAGTYNFPNYKSEHLKILFARKLREWTTLETGVLLLRNVPHRVEFVATMDRVRAWASSLERPRPPQLPEVTDGWVIVGDVRRTPRQQMLRAARQHPFRHYGLYFMVDTRVEGQDIQIWNLVPEEPSWAHWFFVNPYDRPMRPVRDEAAEEKMRREIKALKPRRGARGADKKPSTKGER